VNSAFEQIGFFLEITKDGSPTLRLGPEIQSGESMHHSFGAAAETNYIYKSVIQKALASLGRRSAARGVQSEFRTGVVGLGLAYIEISWGQALIKSGINPSEQVSVDSFELVEPLSAFFKEWVSGSDKNLVYSEISKKLDSDISPEAVRKILSTSYNTNSRIYGDILTEKSANKWNVICFDAFSQKTSGPLWEESFLNHLLQTNAAEDCIFTTYACTSVLKKVLTENNFTFIKRPGFAGKRDSTIALRGVFKDDEPFFRIF
jgi:S-adenosyl-L-methionine-dependent methyltransferase